MKNYHQPSLPSTPLTQTTLLQKGLMNQVVSKVIPPKALQVDNQSSPSEKQQLYNEQYYEQHDEQHEVQHQVQHDRQHDGQQPQLQQQNLVSNESINENYNLNGRNLTQYTQHYDSNETLSDDLRYRSLTKQSNTNRSFMSKLSIVNRKNFTRFTRSKVTFLTINTLLLLVGVASLIFCAMTYASSYPSAQYIINVNSNTLTLLTAVSSLTILNTFLGYIGLLRHYKSILIAYLVFLWPLLLSYIAVGYLSYVANASSGSSLSGVWGQLSDIQKESIQNQYVCCGFLSELDRVTSSQQCNIIDTTSSSLVTKRELTNSIYQNYINSESTKVATVGINKRTPLKRNTGNGMLESLGFQKSINSDKLMKRQSQGSLGLPGCFLTWGRVSSDYLHILTNLGFTSIPFFALAFVIGVLSANHIYD